MSEPVLTGGEWEALLFQCPDQVKALIVKLAVHHRHMPAPLPAECPLCNRKNEPQQMTLGGNQL